MADPHPSRIKRSGPWLLYISTIFIRDFASTFITNPRWSTRPPRKKENQTPSAAFREINQDNTCVHAHEQRVSPRDDAYLRPHRSAPLTRGCHSRRAKSTRKSGAVNRRSLGCIYTASCALALRFCRNRMYEILNRHRCTDEATELDLLRNGSYRFFQEAIFARSSRDPRFDGVMGLRVLGDKNWCKNRA